LLEAVNFTSYCLIRRTLWTPFPFRGRTFLWGKQSVINFNFVFEEVSCTCQGSLPCSQNYISISEKLYPWLGKMSLIVHTCHFLWSWALVFFKWVFYCILQSFAWSQHTSSSGKIYYYNCKTEKSQWEKPKEWIER